MITIIQKAKIFKNNYKPGSFFPIYENEHLSNKSDFFRYKLHCAKNKTLI